MPVPPAALTFAFVPIPPRHERNGSATRLLLVENDPHMADRLRSALEPDGYVVRLAGGDGGAGRDGAGGDGARRDGEEHPDAERPHLIVLDLERPGPDGVELLQRLARRIQDVLRARDAAHDPPPPSPPPALDARAIRARFGLTERQLAVALLLAEGYSNGEIAARLSISPFTARNHVEQVLAKVGAPSRGRAGAILRGGGE